MSENEKAKVGLRYNQGKPKLSNVPTKFIVNLANELSKEENDITYDVGDGEIHLQDALSLVPVEAIVELAKIYGKGCEKYEPENWKLGMNFSHCYNGAMRHLMLFKEGEECDQETGLPHTLHAAWNCITLHWYCQSFNLLVKYDDLIVDDETTQDLLKGVDVEGEDSLEEQVYVSKDFLHFDNNRPPEEPSEPIEEVKESKYHNHWRLGEDDNTT